MSSSKHKHALLILDMMNTFEFLDGEKLLRHTRKCAKNILALKKKCNKLKIPVIYVNDNFGKWKSNWLELYDVCSSAENIGRDITLMLKPNDEDYFVLKPKHSGFYSTTLDVLLRDLKVENLIITGIAGNICVMFTANDAHMRDYKVIVPKDCIASNTVKDNDYAIHHFENVFNFKTSLSTSLKLN
jgi:nicotinamidase-related amidase